MANEYDPSRHYKDSSHGRREKATAGVPVRVKTGRLIHVGSPVDCPGVEFRALPYSPSDDGGIGDRGGEAAPRRPEPGSWWFSVAGWSPWMDPGQATARECSGPSWARIASWHPTAA
jgi:hypothetical protein